MFDTFTSADAQPLLERISELEEQVSNLRRLESTLDRNLVLFHRLLEASREGITLTRADSSIIRVVKGALGFSSNDVCGLSFLEFVHPEDRKAVEAAHQDIVERRAERRDVELRMIRPDGSTAYVQDTIQDMLDDPAVRAIVHNYRDVTSQRDDEMAATELKAVLAEVPFAVFSKDLSGTILTWNAGAQSMFGYTKDEIVGQHIWKLVPVERRAEEEERRKAAIACAEPVGAFRTNRLRKDGGVIEIDLVLAPVIRQGHVRGIVHLSHPTAPPTPVAVT